MFPGLGTEYRQLSTGVMTWVKICGMTNLEDALIAVDAGADAVGFVFYEKSPRCVTVEMAREIVQKLPESVEKVGVFVGDSDPDLVRAVREIGLTGLQHYVMSESDQSGGPGKTTGPEVLPKTFRFLHALPISHMLEAGAEVEGLAKYFEHLQEVLGRPDFPEGAFDTFVFDSGAGQEPGGTGKTFDWAKVRPIAEGMRRGSVKLVVAGGLTAQNVSEAIEVLHPWGVDVVSGVEARPGKKDPEKVRAFVRAVREMDRKVS
jgi:phosphoribosylanthranilate isomerase